MNISLGARGFSRPKELLAIPRKPKKQRMKWTYKPATATFLQTHPLLQYSSAFLFPDRIIKSNEQEGHFKNRYTPSKQLHVGVSLHRSAAFSFYTQERSKLLFSSRLKLQSCVAKFCRGRPGDVKTATSTPNGCRVAGVKRHDEP